MPTYIGFLRAINLGSRHKFSPAQVAAACVTAGCTDVATHINTGNVRLTTTLRSRAKVESMLEQAFSEDRGFPVPTIVFTPAELAAVVADADELAAARAEDDAVGQQYVSVLKHVPSAEASAAVEAMGTAGERAHVRGRAVHLLIGESYHGARLSNATVEKLLGVATNRNVTVMRAIAAKFSP